MATSNFWEIAAQLRQQPGVHEALVTLVATGFENGKKFLVAYIVPQAGHQQSVSCADLRDTLMKRLPDYMVPYHYVVLDHLPLSANGKVDMRQLPAPVGAETAEQQRTAPRTETEIQLFKIWAEVFARADFGVADNFFDLGGNSMDVFRIVTQLQVSFGLQQMEQRTLLQKFFENPTIEALGNCIDEWIGSREEEQFLV
jgi:pyochelin synthetase